MCATKKGCLLFDVDNTLVDRDAAFRRYMGELTERHADAFAGQNQGQGQDRNQDMTRVMETILALDCHGRTDRTLFCRALLQRFPHLPHTEESLWIDHQRLPEFVRKDAVLIDVLARLSRTFTLLVISNGSATMQRQKLQRAELTDFFEQIFISAEVGYAKPDPRLFLHALQACRLQSCHHPAVVMIGDDYVNDIGPALTLGLKTIFINPRKERAPIGPDREIASIHLLEEALNCLI